MGYFTPISSLANEIKDAIFKSLLSNTFHHLKVIGCDGTATSTGANGGIIALIGKHLCHSIQRVIY